MDKTELTYEMKKYGDNQSTLASSMGISRVSLNHKINEKNGAAFNQPELKFMKDRYNLSPTRMVEIFFSNSVSKKDTKVG